MATQFYASLRYVTTHHPVPNLSNHQRAPSPSPANVTTSGEQATTNNNPGHNDPPASPSYRPDSPITFAAAAGELARDLVQKQKQIEALIDSLPGLEKSEEDQVRRIQELDRELKDMEEERKGVVEERERLLDRVENVIVKVRRV